MSTISDFSKNHKHLFVFHAQLLKQILALIVLLWLVIICLSSVSVYAVSNNPFQTVQPVTDQTLSARQDAFRTGMSDVLYILSGDSQLNSNTTISQALGNAETYVSSYSYINIPVTSRTNILTDNPITTPSQNTQLALRINFDPDAIKTLLKSNHYPVWLSARPTILVWFNRQDNHSLISDSSDSPLKQFIYQAFAQADLTPDFPIMDLQDVTALPAPALKNLDTAAIMKASSRYNTPAVLVVRCFQPAEDSNTYTGSFNFFFQEKQYRQNFSDITPQTMSAAAVALLIKPMAAFYGMDQSQKKHTKFTIKVQGITSLKGYADISRYLKKQALINKVTPVTIMPDNIIFSITASGDTSQILASFALDQHLIPEIPVIKNQIPSPQTSSPENNTVKLFETHVSTNLPSASSAPLVFRWYP